VVLRQALQARGGCEALREEQADREGDLGDLALRPAVDVLEQAREHGLLERPLQILVPAARQRRCGRAGKRAGADRRMSLFMTSTYGFRSATSVGSFAWSTEKGESGAPSSM
jgi:hypothetical protein